MVHLQALFSIKTNLVFRSALSLITSLIRMRRILSQSSMQQGYLWVIIGVKHLVRIACVVSYLTLKPRTLIPALTYYLMPTNTCLPYAPSNQFVTQPHIFVPLHNCHQ